MSILITIFLWLLSLLATVIVVLAVSLIIYARWNYGSLEKLGIPVVKPHWFLGSNPDSHKVFHHLLDIERSKTYGHVYGVYDGRVPAVCISDTKIIRQITTTDFEYFRNHRKFLNEHPVTSELLDFLDDEKWKTVRSALTPQFTTGKIKQMSETVREISEEYISALIKDMNGANRKKIEFKQYIPPLIFEIIGKCFCGIVIENARDPNNTLIATLKQSLGVEFFEFDWKYTVANAFPILQQLSPIFSSEAMDRFEATIRGILKGRETSGVQKQDMVNVLLEMCKKAKSDSDYKRLGITDITAISQAFELLVASYEASRTTLSLLTYQLAIHPEIQEKLLKEIDSTLKKHEGKINYESVADLPYLTACISEVLRILPGFFRPDRRCTKDWEYNGLKIKKDMIVLFPLFALQYNPDHFLNPEDFDPERFMPGQKENLDPYAFGVFGHGPRACIGQRFAYEMVKMIFCHYLKEFKIEKRNDTEFTVVLGNPLFLQYKPIYVDFVRRN